MIIVDLNQVTFSNFFAMGPSSDDVDENIFRHMILNSLRSYLHKYKAEYGEMIIACDGRKYWRKEVFPYYKSHRKTDRDTSDINWDAVFEAMNNVRQELKEIFPYRVIHTERAEADDIIGALCHEFGNTREKILIVSGDKDFLQLQEYMNVKQYDPVRKRNLSTNNASLYLKEHIMRGDRGDGIPNFLSADSSLALGTRQTSIMKKKIDKWLFQMPEDFCDENMLRGYKRNEQVIDLHHIPEDIKDEIVEQFWSQEYKETGKDLFGYFMQKQLKHLMEAIGEFKNGNKISITNS